MKKQDEDKADARLHQAGDARTATNSDSSEVNSEINSSQINQGSDVGGGEIPVRAHQSRPTRYTSATEHSGLLSPDSFEDLPEDKPPNVTFVPAPAVASNKASVLNDDGQTRATLNKVGLFTEQEQPAQQTINAAQTALRQLSKAQSYRPAIAMAATTLPKNPQEKAATRRRSRMSRLPASSLAATTSIDGSSTGKVSSKEATTTTSTTINTASTTSTALQESATASNPNHMLDLEAMESRHGAFSIPTRSSSDDDNEDGNSFLSTDSSGPQFMEEDVDYSLLLTGAVGRSSNRRNHITPQVVNLGTGFYNQPETAPEESFQYETTITTAVLVNENDERPMPVSERQRIQHETQQQMLENVHHAEVVDIDNEDKQPTRLERRKRIYLIGLCSLLVMGVIIGGALAGTRCNRSPDAKGCSDVNNAVREGTNRLHDQCVDAIAMSPFDDFGDDGNIFSTTGASPDLELGICGNFTVGKFDHQAVWFELKGTGLPIEMTIRSTALFPTWLAAFGGNCDELQCRDDDVINCQPDVDCSLVLPTLEGASYFFLAGGANPFSFFVKIRETAVNDVCATALALTAIEITDLSIEGSNSNATLDRGLPSCDKVHNNAALGPSVWYSVVGTGSPLHASTCRKVSLSNSDQQIRRRLRNVNLIPRSLRLQNERIVHGFAKQLESRFLASQHSGSDGTGMQGP